MADNLVGSAEAVGGGMGIEAVLVGARIENPLAAWYHLDGCPGGSKQPQQGTPCFLVHGDGGAHISERITAFRPEVQRTNHEAILRQVSATDRHGSYIRLGEGAVGVVFRSNRSVDSQRSGDLLGGRSER